MRKGKPKGTGLKASRGAIHLRDSKGATHLRVNKGATPLKASKGATHLKASKGDTLPRVSRGATLLKVSRGAIHLKVNRTHMGDSLARQQGMPLKGKPKGMERRPRLLRGMALRPDLHRAPPLSCHTHPHDRSTLARLLTSG
jgi:hypothetical protein